MPTLNTDHATFGAGCFWSVEERFRHVPGVVDTAVGYMGGRTKNPTYEEVCSDTTGHVEVVQLAYNPQQTTYDQLLNVFFSAHDPTEMNRQGPDVGTQYRSVIFYHNDEQRRMAEHALSQLQKSGRYGAPIATAIEPAQTFYRAEEYHQRYIEKRGTGSCAA